MDAFSVWVISMWLRIHLSLTEMELAKWQAIRGHQRCCVTSSQGGQGAADNCLCMSMCACMCVWVHVHPLPVHIMYHMHMFSPQICAHIQRQRPLPTQVSAAHSQKKASSWKMRGHQRWDRKSSRPGPNEHSGSLHSGTGTSDTPDDVQRLNS